MKNFSVRVTIRIVLLLGTMCLFAYIFGDRRLIFNHVLLGIVIAAQIAELVYFVKRTNRELAKLFNAIRHQDFSATFSDTFGDAGFTELRRSLHDLVSVFRTIKIEREAQLHFLEALVEQMSIGVIALDKHDRITLINRIAQALLSSPGTRDWKLIASKNPEFASITKDETDGKLLIEIAAPPSEKKVLAVEKRTLIILDEAVRLITFQDINAAIEQKEIEAWHKLIRVLTHEIMNSVTPISSLTETLQSLLQHADGSQKELDELNSETVADIRFSLQTIQKRSEGLLQFVNSYRRLTRIPKPNREEVDAGTFLRGVSALFRHEAEAAGIEIEQSLSPGVSTVNIDQTLMEQVFVNLLTNALHAVEGRVEPRIKLSAYLDGGRPTLEVWDNGPGIPEKVRSQIFLPFFSTKKNGSGIGLSLSKQIVTLHHATITVRSSPASGTSFVIKFEV